MKSSAKLPYKIQFQPEYQHFQQRIGKLPVPPVGPNSLIQNIQQIVDLHGIKQKIRDEELQFNPSNIYFQYATNNQLKEGAKKVSELCPGCGQQNKNPKQCQFCAAMYCKNCCWRKRVIPTLSQPKDYKMQCQDCHAKFIRLFAHQRFYQQSAIFQKIIDSCSARVKKLQQNVKSKKQKFQLGDKRKKQAKIKQNMILKQLKDEQKKVQATQQKLQQVVTKKAEQMKEMQNIQRKKQEQEIQKINREKQIEDARRRQKLLQQERQKIRKQQQLHQQQLKKKQLEAEQQKKLQQARQKQRKIEQQKKLEQLKQIQVQNMRKKLSDKQHQKQANQLKDLARMMVKQPENLQNFTIKNAPETILTSISQIDTKQKQSDKKLQKQQILFTIQKKLSINQQQIKVENKQPIKNKKIQQLSSKIDQNLILGTSNVSNKTESSQKNQKTELTQSTQKSPDTHEQNESKSLENKKSEQVGNDQFSSLPEIAINVTQMTVNELLGIHVNPHKNQNQNILRRQSSLRQSYKDEKQPEFNIEQPTINQLTQQQKYQILRQSNITSTISHHNHDPQQLYEHPDPSGSKCNCMLM